MQFQAKPSRNCFDVVIVGGAIMGSAAAWFLAENPDFDGSILVVERDPSYEMSSTAHTNSCIRQQFSNPLNVRISQFGAEFILDLPQALGGDPRVPPLTIQSFGYLYLADTVELVAELRRNHAIQRAAGAETQILDPDALAQRFPFLSLDDVLLGSINLKDEGYWDSWTVFSWLRRKALERGCEYVHGELQGITTARNRVTSVTLSTGDVIECGHVVNACGPRAAQVSALAGIELPVEPRKRFSWVFEAAEPLDRVLPLTIDPSGVHVRQDGSGTYLVGAAPEQDVATEYDDFTMDHERWESHVWPIIARRIPQFEAIKVISEWAGHYAYNTIDQNAIVGPHPEIENFHFMNGFSGHGLQQAPAMGRGVAEMLTYGRFRTLDLSPFTFARLRTGQNATETSII